MDAESLIREYFVNPVYDRSGYNIVNTLVYALIALFFAFLFFKILRRERIRIDGRFVLRLIPFILLGSTVRVVTDATGDVSANLPNQFLSNSSAIFGLYGFIGASHIYDYSFITTTPGVYVVIGAFTFLSVLFFNRLKRMDLLPMFALILFLLHLLLLIPLMRNWFHIIIVALLTLAGAALGGISLKKMKLKPNHLQLLTVFSHSLDGAASYVAVELFNGGTTYFEQHVLSAAIGTIFGTVFIFYIIKVLFSSVAVYLVESSDDGKAEKNYVLLLLIIFGLAPGVRNALRLLAGV